MSDPLRPVGPGQSIGRLRDADTINAMLDAARWVGINGDNASLARGIPLPANEITSQGRTEILIEAPAVIANHGTVELGGAYLDSINNPARANNLPIFTAIAPTATPAVVAVLTQPASAVGRFVRACINGVCVARINITNTSHRFAVTATGTTNNLVSAATGRIRILDTPIATGIKTYVVQVLNDAEVSTPPSSSIPFYTAGPSAVATLLTTDFAYVTLSGPATVSLPLGTYLVIGSCTAKINVSFKGSDFPPVAPLIACTVVADAFPALITRRAVVVSAEVAGETNIGTGTTVGIMQLSSPSTISLKAARIPAPSSSTTWFISECSTSTWEPVYGNLLAIKLS